MDTRLVSLPGSDAITLVPGSLRGLEDTLEEMVGCEWRTKSSRTLALGIPRPKTRDTYFVLHPERIHKPWTSNHVEATIGRENALRCPSLAGMRSHCETTPGAILLKSFAFLLLRLVFRALAFKARV